jgi:hypothetical protein
MNLFRRRKSNNAISLVAKSMAIQAFGNREVAALYVRHDRNVTNRPTNRRKEAPNDSEIDKAIQELPAFTVRYVRLILFLCLCS